MQLCFSKGKNDICGDIALSILCSHQLSCIKKLLNESRAVSEMEGSNVDACNVQKAEAEAKISELILDIESLKKDHQKV